MKVKICGIMNSDDAEMCESYGADALGFVHIPGRSRSIPVEKIAEICSTLGPMTTKIVVCAPKSIEKAFQIIQNSEADAIQLYTLSPEEIHVLSDHGIYVIRAVPPSRSEATKFADFADALLFENGRPGTGNSYDYSKIPIDCCRHAIIAGGLTIENLHLAKALRPYALDVSTGVENSLGKKDPSLVAEFIRRCKQ